MGEFLGQDGKELALKKLRKSARKQLCYSWRAASPIEILLITNILLPRLSADYISALFCFCTDTTTRGSGSGILQVPRHRLPTTPGTEKTEKTRKRVSLNCVSISTRPASAGSRCTDRKAPRCTEVYTAQLG